MSDGSAAIREQTLDDIFTMGERFVLGPRVLRQSRVGMPAGAVYIGRPSKWGNPFKIGRDGTRRDVVTKYRAWIAEQPDLLAALHELKGRDLVCHCAPQACHGDVLLELANAR